MVQDFLFALPLSAFVLVVHVNKKIDKNVLQSYLADPIKRHICIGCLPNEVRNPILKDKKIVRQLEHIMLTLCALGLMAIAPNPDVKRFVSPRSSVFYVSRSGVLYDTSTSGRGYASVTLPLSAYDKYNYEFNSVDDVVLYWHHLRAIVQSTPLAFRNDVNSEEISQARHKKYSMGQFDKCLVLKDPQERPDNILPLGPNEGVAGFDSALYIHLKRHWDVDPGQNSSVGWFIARFRKQSDKVRTIVETRVANLKKDWNSYVKSLMPSELELLKSKKQKNATQTKDGFFPTARNPVAIDPTAKKRPNLKKPSTPMLKIYSQTGKKKRPMDSVDLISAQNRLHLRSRFNSRERDMLIMIRAVGFFLNPVYRFWLDPAVVRDIMHENIPESRSKTVQSLMAAGVREMVRPARLAYLQRIVRNLSTFQAAFYPSINDFSFRHFFSHRFHPDIIEQSLDMYNTIEDSINETEELEGDLAGTLAVASSSFYNDSSLAVSVDDEVFTMFESAALEQSTQSIKQIRYLESADLHLEKIHVHQSSAPEHPDLPTWQSLIHIIDWSQPSSKHPPPPFEEFLLDIPVSQRKSLRSVYKPIIEAGAIGIKFSDIQVFLREIRYFSVNFRINGMERDRGKRVIG
ncbi:hypothetical protein GCK32_009544 [Trichostrongylus colubriformis]|uniref:Uncharacterized protein n=1 Tax=Trichostrongylus colubriformis TaxID=6319 RepID=A0AAN8EUE1_TRICO